MKIVIIICRWRAQQNPSPASGQFRWIKRHWVFFWNWKRQTAALTMYSPTPKGNRSIPAIWTAFTAVFFSGPALNTSVSTHCGNLRQPAICQQDGHQSDFQAVGSFGSVDYIQHLYSSHAKGIAGCYYHFGQRLRKGLSKHGESYFIPFSIYFLIFLTMFFCNQKSKTLENWI